MRPLRSLFVAMTVVVLALLAGRVAHAHELRTAQIEIESTSSTSARISARGVSLVPPSGCTFETTAGASGVLRCPDGIAGRALAIRGLGERADLASVRLTGFAEAGKDDDASVVTARSPWVTLPGSAARSNVAFVWLRFGAEHVLSGIDHVLFMIALFWQAWASAKGQLRTTAWELARTATAFTVAHSLTLVGTVLGVLHVHAAVAEALIAWSLVLVALDLPRTSGVDSTKGPTSRAALAAAFGLVHGLGFASGLADTRLPEGARMTALLAFNAGVEVGQAFVFAACIASVAVIAKAPRIPLRIASASAYVVGIAGSAMFVNRVVLLFRG